MKETPEDQDQIKREDKYNIKINMVRIRATKEQEAAIRGLSAEQLTKFKRIMGSEK